MELRKVHRGTAIFLGVFIIVHLVNHLAALAGMVVHVRWMESLRLIYRNPWCESLLGIALLIQGYTGLRFPLRSHKAARSWRQSVQFWSGAYLLLFLVIHLSAVLFGRYWLKVDTNGHFGAAGLNHFPSLLFFVPYYALAITAFGAHLGAGLASLFGGAIARKRLVWGGILGGATLSVLIIYGLTGGFRGI